MAELAFSHPGKIGDSLFSLPTVRHVCQTKQKTCDFYTSDYCKALIRLLEYQSYIDNVYIPPNYRMTRADMGIQPWLMPIDKSFYETVYQLGFRSVPDRPLHKFIAKSVGIDPRLLPEIGYEYPDIKVLDEPYIVVSARGQTTFIKLFAEVIKRCPIAVVQIGAKGEFIGDSVDITGLDMLETTTWIAKSKGFVGLMSSQLVLANGFPINRVAVHDGIHWDMRHVVRSSFNHYPINPTADKILELLAL